MVQHKTANMYSVVCMIYLIPQVLGMQLTLSDTKLCNKHQEKCFIDFTITRIQTMVRYDTVNRTSGQKYASPITSATIGNITQFDKRSEDCAKVPANAEDIEHVTVGDGTIQETLAINGEFPGPNIMVYENQLLVINVTNRLLQEATTIHWHGIDHYGSWFMDGVPHVSHCPIQPGESFVYRFRAFPAGTQWYHSHQGAQLADGLAGALIILPPSPERQERLPQFKEEFVMMVRDYYHLEPHLLFHRVEGGLSSYLAEGYEDTRSCYHSNKQQDGASIPPAPFTSALINGKGFYNKTNIPGMITMFQVQRGNYYKFRVINIGSNYAFRISVDDHNLTVISADGMDITPVTVDVLILSIAERFDFYIHADNPKNVDSYWIRAETIEDIADKREIHQTRAILNYNGCDTCNPRTKRKHCSRDSTCKILNCPYKWIANTREIHEDCVNIGNLTSTEIQSASEVDDEHILVFNFKSGAGINGIKFWWPNTLTQDNNTSKYLKRCQPGVNCTDGEACHCTHVLPLKLNHTVQLVFYSIGAAHPIHLHGHHFQVVKVGYPTYNKTTGRVQRNNTDITCGDDEYCRHPRWRNETWFGNNIPGLNLKNPVMKDVVQVPYEGYVVIRFKADNAGPWILHCHFELHLLSGMALIVLEGDDSELPAWPTNLPSCGTFDSPEFLPPKHGEKIVTQMQSTGNKRILHIADDSNDSNDSIDSIDSCSCFGYWLTLLAISVLIGVALICLNTLFDVSVTRKTHGNKPAGGGRGDDYQMVSQSDPDEQTEASGSTSDEQTEASGSTSEHKTRSTGRDSARGLRRRTPERI